MFLTQRARTTASTKPCSILIRVQKPVFTKTKFQELTDIVKHSWALLLLAEADRRGGDMLVQRLAKEVADTLAFVQWCSSVFSGSQ